MIIDKQPLPDDPTPSEAPPSYDALEPAFTSSPYPQNEKAGPSNAGLAYPPSPSPLSPPASISCKPLGKAKASSWFAFGQASRTSREIKSTVLGLVKDLVKLPESSASMSILDSCAEACRAHNLSMSSILQEKSIEGHTSIYWAIVKRPSEPPNADDHDIVSALLSLAAPLSDSTISEIRLACLDTSDQALFQRLRCSPAFAPLSGPDQMLLGSSVPPDDIEVQDVDGDEGAFVTRFHIVMFQKRMRVSKEINLEFIARGRIFRLQFLIADSSAYVNDKHYEKGVWLVFLSLLEHSPPTWIDSRLLIEDPRIYPAPVPSSSSTPSIPIDTSPTSIPSSPTLSKYNGKFKPTISLRLKTGHSQLAPSVPSTHLATKVVAALDDSLMGSSLQYDGSSYISNDGSLKARLEAKLMKPEAECIIC